VPTTVPAPTTIPAPTASTTVAAAVASFPTPSAAGEALFGAWKRGDRQAAGALLVAPPAELDKLFMAPARGAAAKNRGCDDGAFGTASCFFANGQGGVNVTLTPGGGGWQITSIDPFG
jgi:hypothetical protein